ncbi:TPA: hypothetical protein ACX6RU_000595 [Photobacterium damselae]
MDIQHTQYLYERLYQHFEMTSDDEVRRKLDATLFNKNRQRIDSSMLARLADSEHLFERKYYQQLAYNASVLAQRYQI